MIERLTAEVSDSLVIAGHTGYGRELREPSGSDDGEGGIGAGWIVAVALLVVGTTAVLVWLSSSSTKAKLKRIAPGVFIAAVMAAPLMVWAATSGGDEQSLVVERAKSPSGAPEFIVSLAEDDLNSLDTTNGQRTVRVECLGPEGQVVLAARQKWPFETEQGYDYPHIHQVASSEQLGQAARCRLRGTRVRLEADVEGSGEAEVDEPDEGREDEEGD